MGVDLFVVSIFPTTIYRVIVFSKVIQMIITSLVEPYCLQTLLRHSRF